MPHSRKSTPATKKATKRPANATKANNMPSMAELNRVVQSNTTKRDRALIALASVTALGAVGAACGTSKPCAAAVQTAATTIGGGMTTAYGHVRGAGTQVGGYLKKLTSGQTAPVQG